MDLKDNPFTVHHKCEESWKMTLIDTGLNTMTGGRIKKTREYIDDTFMLTYGDSLSNVDINQFLDA